METIQLRPHHLFCLRFLNVELPDRGVGFEKILQKIQDLTGMHKEARVEIIESVDELCKECPDLQEGRCKNPFGNEDDVRKWDGIIVRELGVSYGESRTSGEWGRLIGQKAPLDFCRNRCQWKSICTVFKSV